MITSFKETSTLSDIIIGIDTDEKQISEYIDILCEFHILIIFFNGKTTTEIYNSIANCFNGYDFYHLTNDDFVYMTKDWDKIIVQSSETLGKGIFYGNDTVQKDRMCTAPIISGDIVRSLRWLQMPTLTHLCGDLVWHSIGKKLNILHYLKDVIIEHRHYQNNKAQLDETYRKTNSKEMYDRDWKAFDSWIKESREEDLQRIQLAL